MVKHKLRIIWDNEAKKSLKHIYHYIQKKESNEIAKKVRNKIVTETKSLKNFLKNFRKNRTLRVRQAIFVIK